MAKKKKVIGIVFLSLIVVIAVVVLSQTRGNTFFTNRTIPESEIYSKKDISNAMDVVEKNFGRDYDGCTLTDLWYDENQTANSAGWAEQYDAKEAIVLVSNYKTGPLSQYGSQKANRTYTDWMWILVRNQDGDKWELKTAGY